MLMVVPVVATGLLTVSCTNKSGPVAALSSQPRPEMRKADLDTREKVLAKVAADLEAQKRKLKKPEPQVASTVDIDQLKPAKEVELALQSPKPKIDPSLVAVNETVASIPRVEPIAAGSGPLARFHAKLAALRAGKRTKPVTILHIGDSHVASDSFRVVLESCFRPNSVTRVAAWLSRPLRLNMVSQIR